MPQRHTMPSTDLSRSGRLIALQHIIQPVEWHGAMETVLVNHRRNFRDWIARNFHLYHIKYNS
jgi:hypothetical protein